MSVHLAGEKQVVPNCVKRHPWSRFAMPGRIGNSSGDRSGKPNISQTRSFSPLKCGPYNPMCPKQPNPQKNDWVRDAFDWNPPFQALTANLKPILFQLFVAPRKKQHLAQSLVEHHLVEVDMINDMSCNLKVISHIYIYLFYLDLFKMLGKTYSPKWWLNGDLPW